MNDVKTDLDDAMRMLVALHEEHMGIHEQLDALGVPHVAKRDGQWRLALLTSRIEMAERNLVQERVRREASEQARDAEQTAHERTRKRLADDQALLTECRRQRDTAMAVRDDAKRKLEERDGAWHEATGAAGPDDARKLIAWQRSRLDEARNIIERACAEHDRIVGLIETWQRIDDGSDDPNPTIGGVLLKLRDAMKDSPHSAGRWLVAGWRNPDADSEWHVLTSERWAREEYQRLLKTHERAYLCRVVEGPDGGGKKEPEKAPHDAAPIGNAPAEECVIRFDDVWAPRMRGPLEPSAKTLADAMRYQSEADAQAALGTLNSHWIKNAVVERVSPAPTDVDALLREATDWTPGIVFIDKRGAWDMIRDLATALRAERARAELAESDEMVRACVHLRAVLAHFSPDRTRGPTVARKAHAFLANEAADADVSGPSKARYAIRCAQKAEMDAEDEASRLRTVVAAHDEAEANLRAEVQRLRGELDAEKARHEQTKRDHNADAQAKQENLARALKAEAAVKALQEAVESAYAARVKPSGDVVERLVHAYEVAAVGGDVASESGIRAVLVKVAEMVPSEEEIATSLWESDTQAIVTGGRPFDDCHATTKLRYRRSGGVVRSLILSRLGQTKEGAK